MYDKSQALAVTPLLKIDKENGILREVVILQEGLDKDRGYFTGKFLSELAASSNAQNQGVKCRFGHPTPFFNSLGNFLGRYQNFQDVQDEDGKNKVTADLHLDPITQKTQVNEQGVSMWDYILEMAENISDVFGKSIMFEARDT